MAEIVMPQLGETVTEGTITRWYKAVGDSVERDEVLFEVSTDKVDSEVPSTAAGTLTEIKVPEGDTVDVGTVLAVVGDADGAPSSDGAAEAPEAEAEAEAETETEAEAEAQAEDEPEPEAQAEAEPEPAPRQAPEPAPQPEPQPAAESSDGAGDGRLLSPVVRRLVRENDLDIDKIDGTGAGGRITRSDVQRAIEAGTAKDGAAAPSAEKAPAEEPSAPAPSQAPARPAASPARQAAPVVKAGKGDTTVPLNRIRRMTGDHMVMSKATSPHVLTAVEVDFEAVERVRSKVRGEWKAEEGFSLTYLPFISRALVDAIRDFPHLNASVGEGELVVHGQVNLAIAVDIDFEGLIAPVIKGADGKRLRALAREIVDLASRARTKQLQADEVTGGTITITNPGQYGTMMQFPIINQPQVAILSTDGIRRKPVVVTDEFGNETIGIHSVGILALAWDHRAFDGAYIAAFMDALRTIIETRDWEAELS